MPVGAQVWAAPVPRIHRDCGVVNKKGSYARGFAATAEQHDQIVGKQ